MYTGISCTVIAAGSGGIAANAVRGIVWHKIQNKIKEKLLWRILFKHYVISSSSRDPVQNKTQKKMRQSDTHGAHTHTMVPCTVSTSRYSLLYASRCPFHTFCRHFAHSKNSLSLSLILATYRHNVQIYFRAHQKMLLDVIWSFGHTVAHTTVIMPLLTVKCLTSFFSLSFYLL